MPLRERVANPHLRNSSPNPERRSQSPPRRHCSAVGSAGS